MNGQSNFLVQRLEADPIKKTAMTNAWKLVLLENGKICRSCKFCNYRLKDPDLDGTIKHVKNKIPRKGTESFKGYLR